MGGFNNGLRFIGVPVALQPLNAQLKWYLEQQSMPYRGTKRPWSGRPYNLGPADIWARVAATRSKNVASMVSVGKIDWYQLETMRLLGRIASGTSCNSFAANIILHTEHIYFTSRLSKVDICFEHATAHLRHFSDYIVMRMSASSRWAQSSCSYNSIILLWPPGSVCP